MLTQAQYSALNPFHHIWVHACAGTGKTFVLTYRILRLLVEGVRPERIIALTFTQHAGQEMTHRLYTVLEAIMRSYDECKYVLELCLGKTPSLDQIQYAQRLWSRILDTSLNIQTLHSFCQTILYAFPLEAGLPGNFKILDEAQGLNVWYQQQERVLSVHYPASLELKDSLMRLANRYTLHQITLHLKALWSRGREITFPTGHAEPPKVSPPAAVCPNRLAELIQYLGPEYSQKYLQGLQYSWRHPQYQAFFLTQNGTPRKKLCSGKIPPSLKEWLEHTQMDLFRALQEERRLCAWKDTQDFCHVFSEIYHHYTQHKIENGLLDFSDLIYKTIDLLQNPRHMGWIYSQLDGKIQHILVDEAQDTSPAQWKILRLLSEIWNTHSKKTLFVVGDPKQSIYGFQGADLEQFYKAKQQFQTDAAHHDVSFHSLDLTHSFRSYSHILDIVNDVFENDPSMDFKLHTPLSHQHGGLVELWPLLEVPQGISSGEFFAYLWIQRVEEWITQGDRLLSTGNTIQPEDILILMSKRCSLYDAFSKELGKKGLWSRESFTIKLQDTLLVQDILALIQWLLAPQDDWSLVHIFKSPLFRVCEEDLLSVIPTPREQKTLWSCLEPLTLEPWKTYIRLLVQWKKVFFQTTPFQFMQWWVYSPWIRERYKAWPDAPSILDKLLALLFNFCQENGKGWTQWMEMLSTGNLTLKHSKEKGVGLLTVHSAKGLQSPVVIIPDLSMEVRSKDSFTYTPQGPWKLDVLHHHEDFWHKRHWEQQSQERRRIFYVALTRAQERVYCSSLKECQSYQDMHNALLKRGTSLNGKLDPNITKNQPILRYE